MYILELFVFLVGYFGICFVILVLISTLIYLFQFYMKLEEKHRALEEEKSQYEARKKVLV